MNLFRSNNMYLFTIIFCIIIYILFTILYIKTKHEYFINYPQQVDPTSKIKTNPEATTANNNYASILLYIKNNPFKSTKFIEDIKTKFFNDTCTVKDNINFNNIAQLPDGMPFS